MSKSQKARLVVYNSPEEADNARLDAALRRTPTERFDFLVKLIKAAYMLNGNKPFKELPEGAYILNKRKQDNTNGHLR